LIPRIPVEKDTGDQIERYFHRQKKVKAHYHWDKASESALLSFYSDKANFNKGGRVKRMLLKRFAKSIGRTKKACVGRAYLLHHRNKKVSGQDAKPVLKRGVPAWDKAEFKRDFLSGVGKHEMALKYGVKDEVIPVRAFRMGLKRPVVVKKAKQEFQKYKKYDVDEFKKDYSVLSTYEMTVKYGISSQTVYNRGHKLGIKKNMISAVSGSVPLRKNDGTWLPSVLEEFKKDYPLKNKAFLERKYGSNIYALYVTANKLGLHKDADVAHEERKKGYMLRKRAMVPKQNIYGTITPTAVADVPIEMEFPNLAGANCKSEFVSRSFLSLAKGEFKEISYSGIGSFVLGVSGFENWDKFLSDAMMKSSMIAKVLGVSNKYRIGFQGTEKVIRYG